MTQVFYRQPKKRYPTIDRGEGIYLWDADGKKYLDGSSGALVANLGHGRKEIAQAMADQATRVAFAHTMRFTSEAQEELARRVADLLPYGLSRTYPVSGGSEATETAVKLARQYHLERGETNRFRILTKGASYHGNTLGALSASGHLSRRRPYEPLLSPAFSLFPPPWPGCPGPDEKGKCPCTEALRTTIESLGPDTVAAVLLEPVGGSAASGAVPHEGYMREVASICRSYGILLIADEVMTGFGRTGEALGMVHYDVAPDLITAAKGLSGGYAPLGAVITTEAVHTVIREGSGRFLHGLTYGGHPVAMAAGAKALEILVREHLIPHAKAMGHLLRRGLEAMKDRHPVITDVRGFGLMQGLVLDTDLNTPGGRASRLGEIAFQKGLIIYPGSGNADSDFGDHLLVAPPLIIQPPEVGFLLDLLDDALRDLD